jgi:8-oxo-dGTP pyrophosphatase MutT (NUDIX family)
MAESLVVVRRGSLVLLLHRCAEKGAYWHVAGGQVEESESFADAAVRELREETGLEADLVDLDLPYSRYDDTDGRVFLTDVPAGWEPTLNEEHDGYRWASRVEAGELLRDDEPREAIRRLWEDAPPYRGEGPHALWHVSENDAIESFLPHRRPGHAGSEPVVWAVDTRHLPLYWFPRECPRACFWATSWTSDEDVGRFLGGDRAFRVHLVEPAWLLRLRAARVVAYGMPPGTFQRWDRGFWVSREAVEPLELVELGNLEERHAQAGIRLAAEPELLELWDEVVGSTLEFSGIRLRNARAEFAG